MTIVRILKRRGGGLPLPISLDLHGTPALRFERSAIPRAREPLLTALS